MRRFIGWVAPLLAIIVIVVPHTALAQERASTSEELKRIRVVPEPGAPVVAATILIALDVSAEPASRAGLANLAARAIVAPARPGLDSMSVRLEVDVRKDAVSFTLVSAPDAWQDALRTLLVALFRDAPRGSAVTAERDAIVSNLRARATNPADAVERLIDRAVFGEEHPWGRPVTGTLETVEALGIEEVDDFLREHFTSERAVATVIGPVDAEPALIILEPFVGEGRLVVDLESPDPSRTPLHEEYNSITTWISTSYRFPGTGDIDALRMAAGLIADRMAFGPRSRAVYNTRSDVLRYADGGELRFELVVPPEETDRWARQLQTTVSDLGNQTFTRAEFARLERNHRGERLLALLPPERRVQEHARAIMLSHANGSLSNDLVPGPVTAERLTEAVRALSPPVEVRLGPVLDEGAD